MRFGISGQRLAGQRLGVGRYIEYMIKNWDAILDPNDSIHIYVQEPFDKNALNLSDACHVQHLQSSLKGIFWENLLLPGASRELDVLFCPSYTVPLAYPGRCVVAIHSANEAQSGTHPWWYDLTYLQRYKLSARRADKVIVPSESTKNDLLEHYGISANKVEIVAQGADYAFQPSKDEARKRATRIRYTNMDKPYVLWVGKLSQRRNIPMLLKAFSIVKQEHQIPHNLLLFGPNHLHLPLEQLTGELGITDSVIQTDGKVSSHQELIDVYNAADLYVNASMYEGFSMTLVEAMACGLPVVVSNRAALAEIAGGYGYMVDEPGADSFAEAISKVLCDTELSQSLRARSIERAKSYRWDQFARQTLDILRQVGQS
ncbi:MAG: glycosyltransferase family 4 protein [Anaerolineae bacterium]|nr:glycosyltransferase family 4 protein [Anaerolineae bacterium]